MKRIIIYTLIFLIIAFGAISLAIALNLFGTGNVEDPDDTTPPATTAGTTTGVATTSGGTTGDVGSADQCIPGADFVILVDGSGSPYAKGISEQMKTGINTLIDKILANNNQFGNTITMADVSGWTTHYGSQTVNSTSQAAQLKEWYTPILDWPFVAEQLGTQGALNWFHENYQQAPRLTLTLSPTGNVTTRPGSQCAFFPNENPGVPDVLGNSECPGGTSISERIKSGLTQYRQNSGSNRKTIILKIDDGDYVQVPQNWMGVGATFDGAQGGVLTFDKWFNGQPIAGAIADWQSIGGAQYGSADAYWLVFGEFHDMSSSSPYNFAPNASKWTNPGVITIGDGQYEYFDTRDPNNVQNFANYISNFVEQVNLCPPTPCYRCTTGETDEQDCEMFLSTDPTCPAGFTSEIACESSNTCPAEKVCYKCTDGTGDSNTCVEQITVGATQSCPVGTSTNDINGCAVAAGGACPGPEEKTSTCYRCTSGLSDSNTCESFTVSGETCPTGSSLNSTGCAAVNAGGVCPTEQTTTTCYRCTSSLIDQQACEGFTVTGTACPAGSSAQANGCGAAAAGGFCPMTECSDGIDNDGDGRTDCTAGAEDPGCYPNGNGGGGACNPLDPSEIDGVVYVAPTTIPTTGLFDGNYSALILGFLFMIFGVYVYRQNSFKFLNDVFNTKVKNLTFDGKLERDYDSKTTTLREDD